MAIAKQDAGGVPAQLTPKQMDMVLAGVDTAGMDEKDKLDLALILWDDFQRTSGSVEFKPQRIKIVKDTQTFADPFGNSFEELRGVVLAQSPTRGRWEKGDKRPLCSSKDGITGYERTDENGVNIKKSCATCEFNEWGSATDEDGNQRRGKACKEMRRIFIKRDEDMFPYFVSFPPTSIGAWDDYISARLSRGVSDIKAETILTLVSASVGGHDVSVVKPRIGKVFKPAEIVENARMAKKFAPELLDQDIEADDYFTDDDLEDEDISSGPSPDSEPENVSEEAMEFDPEKMGEDPLF
jgi:hypothetical protein